MKNKLEKIFKKIQQPLTPMLPNDFVENLATREELISYFKNYFNRLKKFKGASVRSYQSLEELHAFSKLEEVPCNLIDIISPKFTYQFSQRISEKPIAFFGKGKKANADVQEALVAYPLVFTNRFKSALKNKRQYAIPCYALYCTNQDRFFILSEKDYFIFFDTFTEAMEDPSKDYSLIIEETLLKENQSSFFDYFDLLSTYLTFKK